MRTATTTEQQPATIGDRIWSAILDGIGAPPAARERPKLELVDEFLFEWRVRLFDAADILRGRPPRSIVNELTLALHDGTDAFVFETKTVLGLRDDVTAGA